MKSSFELFTFNSDADKPLLENNRNLLKSAAVSFGVPKAELDRASVLTDSKGKPYFDKLDIHFSISHSEGLWACLMGPSCCGLDAQYMSPCNYEKIAGRFFSAQEARYAQVHGIEGFYELWTRREALAKYTCEGFFGQRTELVDHLGDILPAIQYKDKTLKFAEIEYQPRIKITACFDAEYADEIIIRRDWNYEDYVFIG